MTSLPDPSEPDSAATPGSPGASTWGAHLWGAWAWWVWIGLLLVAAIATLSEWEDLRLALDFQRHLRAP